MSIVVQIAAGVAAAIHVAFFAAESLLWGKPEVTKTFGVRRDDVETLRLAMLNQGFYNLFLAVGLIYGLVVDSTPVVGTISSIMLGAGVVLVASKRSAAVGAVVQALPPLLVLVALVGS
jgi:putative membrane protein